MSGPCLSSEGFLREESEDLPHGRNSPIPTSGRAGLEVQKGNCWGTDRIIMGLASPGSAQSDGMETQCTDGNLILWRIFITTGGGGQEAGSKSKAAQLLPKT